MFLLGTLANGKKVFTLKFVGPSSDIVIGAGQSTDLTLMLEEMHISSIDFASLARITGISDGLVFTNTTFSDDYKQATIRLYNATSGSITIAAGSVSLIAIGVGY